MSLIVEHLTKEYGPQKAVNNISFEVKAGEIVGFLGPNGAGKSTTLKILLDLIVADSGSAEVLGLDACAACWPPAPNASITRCGCHMMAISPRPMSSMAGTATHIRP